MFSYTSPVFKFSVATVLVALFGAAGLALGSADVQQEQVAPQIAHLDRVVVIGHRTAAVEHLPMVVVVGHRHHADDLQVAKACEATTASC